MSKEDVNKALGIEDDATPYVFNQDGSWDYKEGMTEEKVAELNAMREKQIAENASAESQLVKAGKILNVIGVILAIGCVLAGIIASANTYRDSEQFLYVIMGLVGGALVYLPCFALYAYFKVAANTSNTLKEIRDKISK